MTPGTSVRINRRVLIDHTEYLGRVGTVAAVYKDQPFPFVVEFDHDIPTAGFMAGELDTVDAEVAA